MQTTQETKTRAATQAEAQAAAREAAADGQLLPAPRVPVRGLYQLFLAEAILFWREPAALFFTLFFPVLLVLLFGTIYGGLEIGGGFRVIDVYVPGLLSMVIGNIGFMGLPLTIANYREEGILKRYQVSPLPLWALIAVHIAVGALMFLLSALLLVGVGVAVFQIPVQGNLAGLAVAALFSIFAFFATGLALASATSSVRTVQAVGSVAFFVLFFTSGLAGPRDQFPAWLERVTDYQPMTLVVDMFAALWIGASLSEYWSTLLLLLAIGAVAALIVRGTFRWQA